MLSDQVSIKEEAINYFKGIYRHDNRLNLDQKVKILRKLPKIFFDEEGLKVGVEFFKEEFKHILSNYSRDKSPVPGGWPTEFYLHFF